MGCITGQAVADRRRPTAAAVLRFRVVGTATVFSFMATLANENRLCFSSPQTSTGRCMARWRACSWNRPGSAPPLMRPRGPNSRPARWATWPSNSLSRSPAPTRRCESDAPSGPILTPVSRQNKWCPVVWMCVRKSRGGRSNPGSVGQLALEPTRRRIVFSIGLNGPTGPTRGQRARRPA